MIYITGDLHGEIEINKLNSKNFPQGKNLTKEDYVIVCGDFGLVWNNSNTELYWRKWLSEKPWTTLFVDGNHENAFLLNQYPVKEWNGGDVHKVTDSIIHLMRGQVFTINNKKFFTFGGAESHDKQCRTEHIDWWKEEMPNYSEMDEGIKNLKNHKFSVDYILSHDCSSQTLWEIDTYRNFTDDALNKYFDDLKSYFGLQYKNWFFGHYHIDEVFNKGKDICLYNKIVKL